MKPMSETSCSSAVVSSSTATYQRVLLKVKPKVLVEWPCLVGVGLHDVVQELLRVSMEFTPRRLLFHNGAHFLEPKLREFVRAHC